MIVPKIRVDKDSGLKYKKSFYKFINKQLYLLLPDGINDLIITADQIGRPEYKQSFVDYMEKMKKPDLFHKFDFNQADSKNEPLIQLADFIAGTLTYWFDPEKKSEHSDNFYEKLKNKLSEIQTWPPQKLEISDEMVENCEWDKIIKIGNHNLSLNFISNNCAKDSPDILMQICVLEELLFAQVYEYDGIQTRTSDELMAILNKYNHKVKTKQEFSACAIAPLRDYGILISGKNTGYCLARSLKDIRTYLKHSSTVILPMIARLQKARQSVMKVTENKVDILSDKDTSILLELIKVYSQNLIINAVEKAEEEKIKKKSGSALENLTF